MTPTSASDFAPWLGVFETLRVVNGVPLFMAEHYAELKRAMQALELKSEFDVMQARAVLPAQSGRWRWIVTPGSTSALFSEETAMSPEPVALSVSSVRVGSHNWDARFKTLSYLSHAQAWKTGQTPEVVLLNERGEVASAARSNIFWRRGDRLVTPAHEAGCRCGVVRRFVLQCEKVEEGRFPLTDLLEADEIFLTNSMRGIVSVIEMAGRPLGGFLSADALHRQYAEAVAAELTR
jgi:branched-subunit amino acid aminotransferase/4-amino-4-deoxychorismate lyase